MLKAKPIASGEPPALSITKLLQDKRTHALGEKLMDANLAAGGSGIFVFSEARHLGAADRAAYASLIGDATLAAKYRADPPATQPAALVARQPVAPRGKAKAGPVEPLRGLESPALADELQKYLSGKPAEAKAMADFFAALGPFPDRALEIGGRARNELYADASLIARGIEPARGKTIPSSGAGKILDRWLTESITNAGPHTSVRDPLFPRDFTRVACWLAGREVEAAAPVEPAKPAPGTEQLLAAFAKINDPDLSSRVSAYLSAHPEEVPGLLGFFRQQGLPHGPSQLNAQSRRELYADAMMILHGQSTTPEGLSFPSAGLGTVLGDWINDRMTNTGSARPSDPNYPWTMISFCEWLVKGAYFKQNDAFWTKMNSVL